MPTFTSSTTGRAVEYRRLSPSMMQALHQQVLEQIGTEPQAPVQRTEVAPGEWQELVNPVDPAYKHAHAEWVAQQNAVFGQKIANIVETWAVTTKPPTDEIAEIRALFGMAARSDMAIWLWDIVAPDEADQTSLINAVIGLDALKAAAERAAASFRR